MANKKNIYLDYSADQLESLINRVYSGKIDRENLPRDLYEATINKISQAIVGGFGARVKDLDEYKDASLLMHYLHNCAVFSAAKTFQQVDAMQNSLFDEKGIKVPFSEFKDSANSIFDDFNENWLEAEYNTAFASASMGRQWAGIEDNKEALPLLRYVTVGDDRVREEHAEMEGITLPVDDPFWDSNYPPNDFNCRCTVDQIDGDNEISDLSDDDREELKPDPLFDMNSGKDKLIFKEDHPYFRVADNYEKLKEANFGLPIPPHPRDYIDE